MYAFSKCCLFVLSIKILIFVKAYVDINNEDYIENLNKVELEVDSTIAKDNEIASTKVNETDAAGNSSHGETHDTGTMAQLYGGNMTAQNSGSRLTKTAIKCKLLL